MIISEQEKNRIRGLHNIKEQEVPTDSSGNVIEPNPLLKKSKEEIVKDILVDSEALNQYLLDLQSGKITKTWLSHDNATTQEIKKQLVTDLTTRQTTLNDSIGTLLTFLDS